MNFRQVSSNIQNTLPADRAGHGRRGRPLGSVGRRKLLENNQEALTAELRCELTKPLTPETEARIEMIKHKLQVRPIFFGSFKIYYRLMVHASPEGIFFDCSEKR